MAIELLGCACDTGNGNTGLPNCSEALRVANGLGVINMVGSTGALNRLDLSLAVYTTEFSALLTSAVKSDRLFPIMDLQNVDFPKEDTQYETDNANQKAFLRDGIQSVTAEVWEVGAAFDIKLKQMRCQNDGTFLFTRKGVVGIKKLDTSDGKYYLHPIEMKAFAPDLVMATATTVQKEMIAFDFEATVSKGQLWEVSYADLNVAVSDLVGLLDANFQEETVPTLVTTTVTLEYRLTTDYGSGLLNDQTIDGQLAADFAVNDLTTGSPVTIGTVTEVVNDKYTITYTTTSAGNSMELSMVLASGFEGVVAYTEPS